MKKGNNHDLLGAKGEDDGSYNKQNPIESSHRVAAVNAELERVSWIPLRKKAILVAIIDYCVEMLPTLTRGTQRPDNITTQSNRISLASIFEGLCFWITAGD
jgi:hypothetical protein